MFRRLISVAAIAAWLVFLNPSFSTKYALAQTEKDKNLLQHEVSVTLKLVNVYVTDKKGNPILDLAKEDFIVYDNGKKQNLTEFEKHVLSIPSAQPVPEKAVVEETTAQPPRELMSRKFFLFFDFAYNNAYGIVKAREAALHFIDTQIQPSDEVGVMSYSAIKSLKLHEYLTTNHRKAREVVEGFGANEIAGRADDFEEIYWQVKTGENPRDARRAGHVFQEDIFDKKYMSQFRKASEPQAFNFAQKMIDLAKALRYIAGHKYVVLFSSGVPYSLVYGVQSPYGKLDFDPNFVDWGATSLRLKYEEMHKELSAANCTIYALDTQEFGRVINKDLRMIGAFSLQKMASETGGKYFGNINHYERHVEKIQDLTGSYYVIGYYIDEKWDGEYHRIKVEVDRPGCNVHAQKGYFNPKPFKEYTDLEKMLHLVDLALSEKPLFQTPVLLASEAFPFSAGEEANLCLISKVQKEKLEKVLEGKAEIINIIFDEKENIMALRRQEVSLSNLAGENVYHYSFFSLPPGIYKCRLVIRNLETGVGAVGSSSTVIADDKKDVVRLFPPLLLAPEKNAVYLKSVSKKTGAESDSLSPGHYFHFDSRQYSPLLDGSIQAGSVLPAVVGYSISGVSTPTVILFASLTEKSSGEKIPLDIFSLSEIKEGSRVVHFVSIQIPPLQTGEYVLDFTAVEQRSRSESRVTRSIRIK